MPIEIVPRKRAIKTSLRINILLYSSIVLLLIIIGSTIFLNRLERRFQEESLYLIEVVDQKIIASIEDKLFLREQERRIKDFGYLIDTHSDASIFFDYLEEVTHPKVWFNSISLDLGNAGVSLSGIAESFVVLRQQILALEKNKVFKEVILNNVSLEEEGVIFDLHISLSPEHFII